MSRSRRRSGLTLVELLVAMILAVTLTAAITYAFVAGLDIQRANSARQAILNQTDAMKQRLTQMLQGAKLTTGRTTYFVATTTGQSDTSDLGCDRITFTTVAPGIPVAVQSSQDDFETQQNAYGPVGGLTEVSYGTTPVGDAGSRKGLFERVQHPSDGDSTQGGIETLLSPDVARMGFQFWDGLEWISNWDTTNGNPTGTSGTTTGTTATTAAAVHRLPAAIKVSYATTSAPNAVQSFIVPIPTSDVNDQNPVTMTTGASQ